jgi:hypothetical protein
MATVAKFVQAIAIFLAYLIQLDVDVTGNITAKLCEVGSKFNIFISQQNCNQLDKLCRSCHGNKKKGGLKKNRFFIKLLETSQEYSNIHRSVWKLLA